MSRLHKYALVLIYNYISEVSGFIIYVYNDFFIVQKTHWSFRAVQLFYIRMFRIFVVDFIE